MWDFHLTSQKQKDPCSDTQQRTQTHDCREPPVKPPQPATCRFIARTAEIDAGLIDQMIDTWWDIDAFNKMCNWIYFYNYFLLDFGKLKRHNHKRDHAQFLE